MKRRIIISLAIILMSATFCSAKTDIDKFKVFTKEHPLRVLCDWNFPPYEYLDDNGEPAGFNVEVVDRILSLMNVPHQFIMQDFEKAITELMGGEIHLESEKGCGTTVWVNIPCKRIAIENKVIV